MKKTIFLCYSLFLVLFTIFSYLFVDSNVIVLNVFYSGFAFSKRGITAGIYLICILLFFVFYASFIFLSKNKILSKRDLRALIIASVIVLFFSYPAMLSYDIFNYVATSKVLFFYHENPYVVMPIEFAGDSLLSFMHAANKIALYGPTWIILTGVPYFFDHLGFVATVFSFKLFIILFYFGTSFLIWKMSKNIVSLILFSLNPLVIVETLVSSHNDIAMMFFLLFSYFLIMKNKLKLAILFFLMSIFVKYATFFLLPIFLFLVINKARGIKINWEKVFYYSAWIMIFSFFLSPIREEIYPWYALWFLTFSFLVPNRKFLVFLSIVLSFGLLFRYIPFIFFGTHAGLTPVIKSSITLISVSLILIYFFVRKLWERIFYL